MLYICHNLFKLEPNNEELYIQKANIFSKRDNHKLELNGQAKFSNPSSKARKVLTSKSFVGSSMAH